MSNNEYRHSVHSHEPEHGKIAPGFNEDHVPESDLGSSTDDPLSIDPDALVRRIRKQPMLDPWSWASFHRMSIWSLFALIGPCAILGRDVVVPFLVRCFVRPPRGCCYEGIPEAALLLNVVCTLFGLLCALKGIQRKPRNPFAWVVVGWTLFVLFISSLMWGWYEPPQKVRE
jgi:hypothetical protein